MQHDRHARLTAVLLGTAVGDAIGLSYEGMSRKRVRAFLGTRPLSHRFLYNRGMVSDDTEHTCLAAHALATSKGNVEQFESTFAWHLRLWLLGLPAGIGLATLRALVRLWVGFSTKRSGVFSAGNGPAMRAAILGAYADGDPTLLRELVRSSTRLTHVDPRAEFGALAIAYATALSSRDDLPASPTARIAAIQQELGACEMSDLLQRAADHADLPAEEFANALGLHKGVTGFVNHTVPLAIHIWSRHIDDFRAAIEEAVRLGGDTDTVAAIVGGMVAANTGESGIPNEWLMGILEWPRSPSWMRRLAESLASGAAAPSLHWPATLLRNAFFTAAVFVAVFRRALPPYG